MRILSGIQPTSSLHIGNYFGAIKQWLLLKDYECIFFIADLHSLTTHHKDQKIHDNSLEILASYIACGLDPKKCRIFLQSHNHFHTSFAWILSCITYMGEINRMVQMKDKSKTHNNVGILTYPILMAADILLYNPSLVPVGQDQLQHLELARTLAQRLNHLLGQNYFNLPESFKENIYPIKIFDLTDGTKKMSKSYPKGCLFLTDSPEEITNKIKKAKTDSFPMPMVGESYDHRPEIKNLINIYYCFTEIKTEEIIKKFQGQNLSKFKEELIKVAIENLIPIGNKIRELMNKKEILMNILLENGQWAIKESKKVMDIVHEYFFK